MKRNNENYLQNINLSQLTLSEKTEVENFCRATPYLVISQSSSSRIQTHERKFNPAVHAKYYRPSGHGERKV
jgi:uncharacterized protein YecA (UPF0149 family)